MCGEVCDRRRRRRREVNVNRLCLVCELVTEMVLFCCRRREINPTIGEMQIVKSFISLYFFLHEVQLQQYKNEMETETKVGGKKKTNFVYLDQSLLSKYVHLQPRPSRRSYSLIR